MTVRTVRAVFFDVDGTLVPHATKTIPTGSRSATAKRSARGRSDGQNDIEMRRGFGLGIAMGNACEEAKGAADYVTSDIDDEASTLGAWDTLLTFLGPSAQEGVEQLGRAGMRVNPTTELSGGHP